MGNDNNPSTNSTTEKPPTDELNRTMMQTTILDNLFKTFKTPDIIREMDEFKGDIRTLHQFINDVEDIFIMCQEILPADTDPPVTFIKAIRNKIKGEANEILIANDISSSDWDEIKNALITHYSDPRSEVALIRDLHRTRQGILTSKQFYNKVIEIQTALIAHSNLHGGNSSKRMLFKEMCLAQFIANLREPLGSNIRSRNPQNMTDALEACISEENMYYIKYQPPTRRFPTFQNTEQKPKVTFKPLDNKQIIPYQPKPGPSGYYPKSNWVPKQEYNNNKTRFPAIKQERNVNITETEETEVESEEDDEENLEDTEDFFQENASETRE